MRIDRVQRLIEAGPDWVYRALVEPELLLRWLPPKGARAALETFDPRPGGAFAMTLTFDFSGGGKTTADSDRIDGRFLELEPGRSVVQAFRFESADPAFAGTMTMRWTLESRGSDTLLTVTAEDVPAGISPEDHQSGISSSLEKLAHLARTA